MPPNALGRVSLPCCGLQHQCVALIGDQGPWESDNWVSSLQMHIMAHTATAEELSNLPSAHQVLLQLNICPARFLQNSIHIPLLCAAFPHSLPLCQPAGSCLASGFGEGVPALGLGSSSVPSVALGSPETDAKQG